MDGADARNHAETAASDQFRGAVALPPKQARAYGALRLSLLVVAVAQKAR